MTNTLTAFYLFYCQVVSKNDVLNLFFDTPRSLFAHNLSKVYEGAALVREISPEIRMRCRKNDTRPGFLPKYPDEKREITLPSMVPAHQLACGLRIRRTRCRLLSISTQCVLRLSGGMLRSLALYRSLLVTGRMVCRRW